MPLAPVARRFRRGNLARLVVPLLALWKLLWRRDAPLPARLVALATVLYVLSPVDLVPDVVPVLGWLDDLVVIPLGIALAARLSTRMRWRVLLAEAQDTLERTRALALWTAAILLLVWLGLIAGLGWWLLHS